MNNNSKFVARFFLNLEKSQSLSISRKIFWQKNEVNFLTWQHICFQSTPLFLFLFFQNQFIFTTQTSPGKQYWCHFNLSQNVTISGVFYRVKQNTRAKCLALLWLENS